MSLKEQLKLYIPKFLTQKNTVSIFLLLVVFFSIFFIVVYRPIGLIQNTGILSFLSYRLYSFILVAVGMVIVAISRNLLYSIQRRHNLRLHHYMVWLLVEFGFLVMIISLLAWFINVRGDVSFLEVLERVAISAVALLAIPLVIAVLIFLLQEKRQEIATLTNQLKTAPVPAIDDKTDNVIQFYDKGGHLVFVTKHSNVLYIESADNYTVIHYISGDKEDTLILHNSMKNMAETLASEGMVRCHRGYLVNLINVKYLRKEKDGLVLEMAHCDRLIPISKTYADNVVKQFAR